MVVPARSLPFRDIGINVEEIDGDRRSVNSVASRENMRLRSEDNLA